MLCLHNVCGIFRKFFWLYYLYLQIQNWRVLFIHETFLVYQLEKFKNCMEVKHMIMIIAIICIFFILCDIWSIVENYFQKILSHHPLKKPTPPKNSKSANPPFLSTWKFFSPSLPPAERGEDPMTWELYGIADRNHACIDGSRATYQIGDNSFISIKKKKTSFATVSSILGSVLFLSICKRRKKCFKQIGSNVHRWHRLILYTSRY